MHFLLFLLIFNKLQQIFFKILMAPNFIMFNEINFNKNLKFILRRALELISEYFN